MSVVTNRPTTDRVLVRNVSWEGTLEIWLLRKNQYVRRESSKAVPILNTSLVSELIEARRHLKRSAWLRETRKRIRALL
jgi:hypothetical protein